MKRRRSTALHLKAVALALPAPASYLPSSSHAGSADDDGENAASSDSFEGAGRSHITDMVAVEGLLRFKVDMYKTRRKVHYIRIVCE